MMGFEPTHIGITIRGLDRLTTRTILVRPEGFEPPAPAFVAQCSIQMSYGRIQNLAVLGGNDPHSYGVTSRRASMNTLGPKLVETDGFEPPRFLGARFTVSCNQPLCHVSKKE